MDAIKLLGQLLGKNATGGNMLGQLLKGATSGGGNQSGGLGVLGGLLGGGNQSGGSSGGGGLLGALAKAAMGGQQDGGASQSGGLGGLLGGLLGGQEQAQAVQEAPPQQVQDQATLMIRAMCNAAKADGQVDEQEQKNIIGRLGDVDQAEIDFLRRELSSPLDVPGFVNSVPREWAPQIYALSLATVKVDTRAEVGYLQQLAKGLQLDDQTLGQIHQQLGVA